MNIIILTFINSYNYGAFLQAKATEVLVHQRGIRPRFLNYSNPEEENQRKVFCYSRKYTFLYNLKRIVWKLWFGYFHGEIKNGKRNFGMMIDDLPKTQKYDTLDEIEKNENIDVLICGSDQIWNPEIYNGTIDPVYYGGIRGVKTKLSFASSFGSYMPDKNELLTLKSYFSDFDALSVREEFAKEILISMELSTPVEVVLDPTLCLTGEEWKILLKKHTRRLKSKTEDYAVLYLVNPTIQCQGLIDYVKKERDVKILWIKNNDLKKFQVDEIITDASPYDFVNLIANAEFVLTDSFHGTAFAVNFNIDFASILNSNNPERAKYLCTKLGLMDRLVDENECRCNVDKINYRHANSVLHELRKSSINWLENVLENA